MKMAVREKEKSKQSIRHTSSGRGSRRNSGDWRREEFDAGSSKINLSGDRSREFRSFCGQPDKTSAGGKGRRELTPPKKPFSMERTKSSECLVKKSDREKLMDMFDKHKGTGQGGVGIAEQNPFVLEKERSNILDSTTLISSISDKNKLRATADNESPFDSGIIELADLENSSSTPRESSPRGSARDGFTLGGDGNILEPFDEDRPDRRDKKLTQVSSNGDGKVQKDGSRFEGKEDKCSEKDENLIRDFFRRIDIDGSGEIRSFDVLLSNLPPRVNNELHEILSQQDNSAEEGFKSYNYDSFRKTLLASPKFFALRSNK